MALLQHLRNSNVRAASGASVNNEIQRMIESAGDGG
jgi:hypothetical protein